MTSPLNTIQELVDRDLHYPWRVLVVCALLNQTHGRGVRPMIDEFFRRVPDPETMLRTDMRQIDDLLRPLGFHNRRFNTLCRMTQDYLHGRPYDNLYGVGPYARDAIDLYVRGATEPLRSNDTWLEPYRQWRLNGGERVTWNQEGHERWLARVRTTHDER